MMPGSRAPVALCKSRPRLPLDFIRESTCCRAMRSRCGPPFHGATSANDEPSSAALGKSPSTYSPSPVVAPAASSYSPSPEAAAPGALYSPPPPVPTGPLSYPPAVVMFSNEPCVPVLEMSRSGTVLFCRGDCRGDWDFIDSLRLISLNRRRLPGDSVPNVSTARCAALSQKRGVTAFPMRWDRSPAEFANFNRLLGCAASGKPEFAFLFSVFA
mmetsp:Transcript_13751/g.45460  ORF Transcript_13751/g.45460 Transcript_13751/m.45460 type:complete len:214 (-) Transcript_13751:171-812(-)